MASVDRLPAGHFIDVFRFLFFPFLASYAIPRGVQVPWIYWLARNRGFFRVSSACLRCTCRPYFPTLVATRTGAVILLTSIRSCCRRAFGTVFFGIVFQRCGDFASRFTVWSVSVLVYPQCFWLWKLPELAFQKRERSTFDQISICARNFI